LQEIRGYVVDLNGAPTELYEGDRIVRKSSRDAYENLEYKKYQGSEDLISICHEHFTKINTDEFSKLMPTLNNNERIFLFSIQGYIAFDSCVVTYRNNKPVDIGGLCKVSNLSEPVIYRVIKSLRDKGILAIALIKNGKAFVINPWLVMRGTKVNATLKTLFADYYIQTFKKRWGDLK
jgi:hypothetical protein